jgi:putative cardiolipin synthase
VVNDISADFDAYWNSESAYPASTLISAPPAESTEKVREEWAKLPDRPDAARYIQAVRDTPLVRLLEAGALPFEWVPARLVSDDPSKILHPPDRTELHMLPHLETALGKPTRELDLVSPYFVPGKEGAAALRALAERGVKVRVLTNSLAATDVAPVHAGYAKYREDLLRSGVRLYELKPAAQPAERSEGRERGGVGGSSDASLHAKTFAVDRSRIFIGSFNLDPRSARLNTEMGVVLESTPLASQLSRLLDHQILDYAYEVRLAPGGNGLEWIEGSGSGATRFTSEPGAGLMKRLWIGFLSILPIEWLL